MSEFAALMPNPLLQKMLDAVKRLPTIRFAQPNATDEEYAMFSESEGMRELEDWAEEAERFMVRVS
jgi:hypothetical protein